MLASHTVKEYSANLSTEQARAVWGIAWNIEIIPFESSVNTGYVKVDADDIIGAVLEKDKYLKHCDESQIRFLEQLRREIIRQDVEGDIEFFW